MRGSFLAAVSAAMIAVSGAPGPAEAEQKFIRIGTGGVTGVYYPTGGAICRLVNQARKEHGFRCWVESTNGSIDNIEAVRSGDLDFGVVQSDWQFHAYRGSSGFDDKGAFEGLRSVFSIYPEPVTIVARKDAAVETIADLKGKRLSIGNPGSGARGTWDVLEKALGWERSDLKKVLELPAADSGDALCGNEIDAYFWLVGHPSALTEETLTSCGSNLVQVTGEWVDTLVAANPFYRKSTIIAGMYTNMEPITSFGVSATFVTSSAVPDDAVYTVVKAVVGNIEAFRLLHPAFAGLDPAQMIKEGLTAPLHDGAVKAYKEMGLLD
ncbi:MAG: TAXI family TRAP transporter solute-binding subunit [Hyphomicrobiales bacterium]